MNEFDFDEQPDFSDEVSRYSKEQTEAGESLWDQIYKQDRRLKDNGGNDNISKHIETAEKGEPSGDAARRNEIRTEMDRLADGASRRLSAAEIAKLKLLQHAILDDGRALGRVAVLFTNRREQDRILEVLQENIRRYAPDIRILGNGPVTDQLDGRAYERDCNSVGICISFGFDEERGPHTVHYCSRNGYSTWSGPRGGYSLTRNPLHLLSARMLRRG